MLHSTEHKSVTDGTGLRKIIVGQYKPRAGMTLWAAFCRAEVGHGRHRAEKTKLFGSKGTGRE